MHPVNPIIQVSSTTVMWIFMSGSLEAFLDINGRKMRHKEE